MSYFDARLAKLRALTELADPSLERRRVSYASDDNCRLVIANSVVMMENLRISKLYADNLHSVTSFMWRECSVASEDDIDLLVDAFSEIDDFEFHEQLISIFKLFGAGLRGQEHGCRYDGEPTELPKAQSLASALACLKHFYNEHKTLEPMKEALIILMEATHPMPDGVGSIGVPLYFNPLISTAYEFLKGKDEEAEESI